MNNVDPPASSSIHAVFHVASYIKELMRNYATIIAVGILVHKINDIIGYAIFAIIYFGSWIYSLEAPYRWAKHLSSLRPGSTLSTLGYGSCLILAVILLYFPWHFIIVLTSMTQSMFGH